MTKCYVNAVPLATIRNPYTLVTYEWQQYYGRHKLNVGIYQNGTHLVATGNTLFPATNSLPVLCRYTYTCDVCNKTLRISLKLKVSLHTPQKYGHFSQDMLWWIPINTTLTLQTHASRIFNIKQWFLCISLKDYFFTFTNRPFGKRYMGAAESVYLLCNCCGYCFTVYHLAHSIHSSGYLLCFLETYEKSIP